MLGDPTGSVEVNLGRWNSLSVSTSDTFEKFLF